MLYLATHLATSVRPEGEWSIGDSFVQGKGLRTVTRDVTNNIVDDWSHSSERDGHLVLPARAGRHSHDVTETESSRYFFSC